MKSRTISRLAALALAATATPALAQEPAATRDTLPAFVLEELVVSSRRTPELRQQLPQQVEVVTASDLRRTLADDVTEALKKNAAVDLIQYPGLLSGVSVRGFRPQFSGISTRTLILLDGRPAGLTNLATLDLTAVERIEVLRGPASALYGSSAMGGVVNVVTRRSRDEIGGSASGSFGSFGSYRGGVSVGGGVGGGLSFDLDLASAGRSEGYRTGTNRLLGGDEVTKRLPLTGASLRLPESGGDTVVSFSEYATRSGSLRLGWASEERWGVEARGGFFQGDQVQNPGDLTSTFPYPTLNDLGRYTGELGVTASLGTHSLRARFFGSRETTDYFNSATEPEYVSFRQPIRWLGAQIQDVVALGAHSLTAGVDLNDTRSVSESFRAAGTPSAPYNPNSAIRSAAAFAEGRLSLLDDRLIGTLGGRLDRIRFDVLATELLENARAGRESHTVFNPSGGLLYLAPGGVRLHGSAGRAFVAPDAFAVAGYVERRVFGRRAATVTRGNPALDPESSVTWDAGIGLLRPRAGVDADLTYFHTDVRDRISTRLLPATPGQLSAAGDSIIGITTYQNVDRSEIRGLEGRIAYDLGARAGYRHSLRLFASGTRILAAEEINADRRADITHVAALSATFGAEFDDLRRFSGRLAGRYVGERTAPDYNDWQNVAFLSYPEFLVFDALGTVRLRDRFRVALGVENLTDENYYEIRGYNLPGRSVQLQVGVEF